MQRASQKLKNWFKNSVYLSFVVLFVFVGLGCASTRKTTKTETVVTQSNDTTANEAFLNICRAEKQRLFHTAGQS